MSAGTRILSMFRGSAATGWRRFAIGLEFGNKQFQLGVVGLQLVVSGLQVQDVGDAGQVHALVDQVGDPLKPLEVVVAVTPNAPFGARRVQQSPAFIEPQRLRPDARELRCHRDAVHAARRP